MLPVAAGLQKNHAMITVLIALMFVGTLGLEGCDQDEPAPDPATVLDDAIAICAFGVGPDTLIGFVSTVPSLDEGTTDASTAIELSTNPHCGVAFGAVYAATFGSPTLTRYERNADGQLTPTGEVSFMPAGLTSLTGTSRSFVFLSEEEALYVDRVTGIIVRWNPTEMTILSSFEIPDLVVEGEQASLQPVLAGPEGDELLLYGRFAGGGLLLRRSLFIRVNMVTEESTVDVDERCGGLASDIRASDGAIYFASSPVVSAYEALGLNDDPPCILRVQAGADEFDPDFFVNPRTLTPSDQAGSLLDIQNDSALILSYDAEIRDPSNFLVPIAWANAEAWAVYRIDDIKNPTKGTRIDGFPPQTGQVNELLEVDDQRYLLRVSSDLSESTFQNVTDLNNVQDGLTFQGGVVIDAFFLE
ncbi:MAG: hypothetical protein AAGA48_03680 [Myxococcota bacterium]